MRANYKQYKKIYYSIPTHIVFCTSDRRPVFDDPRAVDLFRKACRQVSRLLGIEIFETECIKEYVHLYIQLPPNVSASEAITKIKRETAAVLNKRILKLKDGYSVWTWHALVAAEGEFRDSDVKAFVEEQKVSGKSECNTKGEKRNGKGR